MGVVAPGNKQVGSWTFNLLTNSKSSIKVNAATGFGLVQTQTVATPTVPYNVNLGTYSLNLLSSTKGEFKISQVLGLAVVKYTPPTTMYFHSALGLAAVKDLAVGVTVAKLKNVGIGGLTFTALTSSKNTVSVSAVVGLALVQFTAPRKESTYHSINYGLNNTVKV